MNNLLDTHLKRTYREENKKSNPQLFLSTSKLLQNVIWYKKPSPRLY